MRHLFINPHIEIVSPIEARGSMDMLAMRPEGGTWAIAATLRYSDRYVRTDDGWRFAERLLKPMMP
jgi:anthranilate 1,2-dioxygenase small subunit